MITDGSQLVTLILYLNIYYEKQNIMYALEFKQNEINEVDIKEFFKLNDKWAWATRLKTSRVKIYFDVNLEVDNDKEIILRPVLKDIFIEGGMFEVEYEDTPSRDLLELRGFEINTEYRVGLLPVIKPDYKLWKLKFRDVVGTPLRSLFNNDPSKIDGCINLEFIYIDISFEDRVIEIY